ncbi:hypothetical protein J2X65_003544 [Ancylobacter sp. 3268]|uniref:DUF7146 domain-containing protein n=1 Tax=Ancylobacter sp. 3268 TaxID=2817752 RepID=UPI0028546D3A|nr:toprim domain-containing protein [Ancylobacter sp. 3268]MDR6954176.1 hypothetical protein [Ancylobacter sp. 3268]
MSSDLTYQEIVNRLNDMAEAIAEQCIPNGKREGVYWRGDLHGKVSVHIRGGRAGTVGYWQGQHVANAKGGGNLITLIELAFNCKTHGDAVQIAKTRFLGLEGRRELTAEEKREWARQQDASKRQAEKRRRADERDRQRKAETASAVWHEAVPIAGTPAEEYLRTRSIELTDFPQGTGWMPSLRYHPAVMLGRERHPALIGGVQAANRKLIAIWRIFIGPDGRPLLDGDGKKIKLGLGPAAGGAVRLAPQGPVLRLTEGIETGLGVMLLTCCRVPVWATLSTSGMVNFQIPAGVRRIEIYADADRYRENIQTGGLSDPPGIKAAKILQERAINEGIEAAVYPSPEPDDWLDCWVQRKKDERQQRFVQYF